MLFKKLILQIVSKIEFHLFPLIVFIYNNFFILIIDSIFSNCSMFFIVFHCLMFLIFTKTFAIFFISLLNYFCKHM